METMENEIKNMEIVDFTDGIGNHYLTFEYIAPVNKTRVKEEHSLVRLKTSKDYRKAQERDLRQCRSRLNGGKAYRALCDKFGQEMVDAQLDKKAASIQASIDGVNARSTAQHDAYEKVTDVVRRHRESGDLMIYGFLHHKKVIKKGEMKPVKSKPETLCMKAIERYMQTSRFRQYKLDGARNIRVLGVAGYSAVDALF